jgi:hypothetical protein
LWIKKKKGSDIEGERFVRSEGGGEGRVTQLRLITKIIT